MRKLLGVMAVVFMATLGYSQEEGKPQDPKREEGPTPEELMNRRASFYDLCRKLEKSWQGWTGKIHLAVSDPVADSTEHSDGTVWVRKIGKDKSAEELAPRELAWEVGAKMPNQLGQMEYKVLKASTHKDAEVVRADLFMKTAEIYNTRRLDVYFFEQLVRDGLSKSVEKHFTVTFHSDPRYHKDAPTKDDMKHLGYESAEEMDKAMAERKAKFNGRESKLDENRPWKDKEDKFDNYRLKKDGHKRDDGKTTGSNVVYKVEMVPKDRKLKRAVHKIHVYFHPETYLPFKMILMYPNDRVATIDVKWESWMDVDVPYAEEKFNLELDALKVSKPQDE